MRVWTEWYLLPSRKPVVIKLIEDDNRSRAHLHRCHIRMECVAGFRELKAFLISSCILSGSFTSDNESSSELKVCQLFGVSFSAFCSPIRVSSYPRVAWFIARNIPFSPKWMARRDAYQTELVRSRADQILKLAECSVAWACTSRSEREGDAAWPHDKSGQIGKSDSPVATSLFFRKDWAASGTMQDSLIIDKIREFPGDVLAATNWTQSKNAKRGNSTGTVEANY